MTRYEALFILNLAGREEGVKDVIDRISAAIVELGGKVETVQKMDKRAFSRVTDKKTTGGFYVNYAFAGAPGIGASLRNRFARDEEVYRVMVSKARSSLQATPVA